MGQAHYIINLDRQEILSPHAFGEGYKFGEFAPGGYGIMLGLAVLLSGSDDSIPRKNPIAKAICGRWSGNRVAILGECYHPGDIHGTDMGYDEIREKFVDISSHVVATMEQHEDIEYCRRKMVDFRSEPQNSKLVDGKFVEVK